MSNKRFSLISLLLLVSLVATILAWSVARREVTQLEVKHHQLQQKHQSLRSKTRQIEATDPEWVYVTNLTMDVPNAFRYRIAVPKDTRLYLDCRYEVDGKPVALKSENQLYGEVSIGGISFLQTGVPNETESHETAELTLYMQRKKDGWVIGSVDNAASIFGLLNIFDDRLSWLDGPLHSFEDPLEFPDVENSYKKSQEIILEQIASIDDDLKKHVIRFVLIPNPVNVAGSETKQESK